jgi:hypothetical protein
MPRNRAAEILYDSEAALRLVVSELGELRRPSTLGGALLLDDEGEAPGAVAVADAGRRPCLPAAPEPTGLL